MSSLFHQNMLRLHGIDRDNAFGPAFANIAGQLRRSQICVAGFTEVMNNAGSVASLQNLSGQLGVTFIANVACGRTALNRNNDPQEYIGIAVSAGAQVLGMGRAYYEDFRIKHDYVANPAPAQAWAPPANWCSTFNGPADYRCVVFVKIQLAHRIICVGFIHNMYSIQPNGEIMMSRIPNVFDIIYRQHNPAEIYLGGDFNVTPAVRGTLNPQAAATQQPGNPLPVPPALQPNQMYTAGGTTWNGRLYDYWYAYGSPQPPQPIVYDNTLTTPANSPWFPNKMSDHAASVLNIY